MTDAFTPTVEAVVALAAPLASTLEYPMPSPLAPLASAYVGRDLAGIPGVPEGASALLEAVAEALAAHAATVATLDAIGSDALELEATYRSTVAVFRQKIEAGETPSNRPSPDATLTRLESLAVHRRRALDGCRVAVSVVTSATVAAFPAIAALAAHDYATGSDRIASLLAEVAQEIHRSRGPLLDLSAIDAEASAQARMAVSRIMRHPALAWQQQDALLAAVESGGVASVSTAEREAYVSAWLERHEALSGARAGTRPLQIDVDAERLGSLADQTAYVWRQIAEAEAFAASS